MSRADKSFLEPSWEEKEAGEPWRGPSVERVFKGRQGMAITSTCGEPSTRWVLPVEMAQTLWGGHLWGEGRTTPGGLSGISEGEQNTAGGCFAKVQIHGLTPALISRN